MKERVRALDGLRGLAAVGVAVFFHYQHFEPETFPFAAKAYWVYAYGDMLIDLFFVLSGFVFCHVYRDRIHAGAISFKRFAQLRLSRLYPVHLLTLLLVAGLQFVRHQQVGEFFVYEKNDVMSFLLNVLFLQNGWIETDLTFNGPAWSVSVELMAYALFFAVLVLSRSRTMYLVGFALLIILGLSLRGYPALQYPVFNWETSRVLVGFFVGCMLFELHHLARRTNRSLLVAAICAVLLAGIIAAAVVFGQREAFGDWRGVYVLGIFPAIMLLALNVRPLAVVLGARPLVYLGDISYALYMIHFPVQLAIVVLDQAFGLDIDFSSRTTFAIYTAGVLGAAVLLHHLFEMPLQRRLRAPGEPPSRRAPGLPQERTTRRELREPAVP